MNELMFDVQNLLQGIEEDLLYVLSFKKGLCSGRTSHGLNSDRPFLAARSLDDSEILLKLISCWTLPKLSASLHRIDSGKEICESPKRIRMIAESSSPPSH